MNKKKNMYLLNKSLVLFNASFNCLISGILNNNKKNIDSIV